MEKIILILGLMGIAFNFESKGLIDEKELHYLESVNPPRIEQKVDRNKDLTIWEQAEEKYNIEWELLKAIWKHETDNGKSYAWKTYNNPGGLMYWDKTTKSMKFYVYESQEKGIMDLARRLRKYYFDKGRDTIEEIGEIYCPVGVNDNGYNKYWIPKVEKYYNEYRGN